MKTTPPTPSELNDHFHYYHAISVRYADLDPQKHVNNATLVTYLESARMGYYQVVGIWDGLSFDQFGMVVAALHIDYLRPIRFGQNVNVGLGVRHMGNKSLRFRFQVQDADDQAVFARGEITMVAYDVQADRSIPIPDFWRKKIETFEAQGDKE